MAKSPADPCRRRWINVVAATALVAPFGAAVLCRDASGADLISESDPAAMALKYKADASKAPERTDPTAYCDTCTYYTGKPDAGSGPCVPLGNRLVAAKGWCASWEGY